MRSLLPVVTWFALVGAQAAPAPQEAPPAISDAAQLLAIQLVDDRMTVPVSIGGRGPYRFVIDTGSERTVVSRQLSRMLGLAAGPGVVLATMTGRATATTAVVPELVVDGFARPGRIDAPRLEAAHLGAAGLLGLDTLAGHAVAIDFDAAAMTVRPSVKRRYRPARGEIVVEARSLYGQLIVTGAYFGRRRIAVILDTGTSISVGNLALKRLVDADRRSRPIALTSVTGEVLVADHGELPQLRIGDVSLRGMPIAFADAAPFRRLGLEETPALLLGTDGMQAFRRVEIDFANRQIRFLLPREIERRIRSQRSPLPW